MERKPDVEMSFSVRAQELRFECKPEVDVVAFADSPAAAELQSERDNLPDEVEPGVRYHDAEVRWSAAAWLGEPNWEEALSKERRTRRLSPGAPAQEL